MCVLRYAILVFVCLFLGMQFGLRKPWSIDNRPVYSVWLEKAVEECCLADVLPCGLEFFAMKLNVYIVNCII